MSDIRVVLGITFAFIVGFFVFVGKIQFVQKILAAKVDANVFNLSLALCFVASGENNSLFLAMRVFPLRFSGVGTMIYLPCTVWLIGIHYRYVSKFLPSHSKRNEDKFVEFGQAGEQEDRINACSILALVTFL